MTNSDDDTNSQKNKDSSSSKFEVHHRNISAAHRNVESGLPNSPSRNTNANDHSGSNKDLQQSKSKQDTDVEAGVPSSPSRRSNTNANDHNDSNKDLQQSKSKQDTDIEAGLPNSPSRRSNTNANNNSSSNNDLQQSKQHNGSALGKVSSHAKKLTKSKSGSKVRPISHSESKSKNLSNLFSEHTWDVARLAHEFPESNIDVEKPERSEGLSSDRAQQLLEENGPNRLPSPKEISDLRLFINQFLNMLWILLGVAAALNLAGYFATDSNGDNSSLYVTIIIYVMIVVMCYVSFYQEREARRVVAGFQNLLPSQCVVIRDGAETTLESEALVVGDVIRIKSGIKLPADARVIACTQLKLETSSITGESEPMEYQPESVADNVNIFESHNVAFNGSYCVDGEGVGVVIRCGTDTVIGHIAQMTTDQRGKDSHLEWQIKVFVKFLTVLACVVGIGVFVIGGIVQSWHNVALLLATSFAVCAVGMIPEGMPATVTSCLTLVARRMASRNVYLKKLDIVETLGCARIIASDKTGTLTKNEMTVTDVWYSNEFITDIPEQRTCTARTMTVKTISRVRPPLSDLLVAMTICNTASFDESTPPEERKSGAKKTKKQKHSVNMDNIDPAQMSRSARRRRRMEEIQGKRTVGAPSEVALIKYAEQLINVHDFRRRYNVVFEIPFNSKRKYHAVIAKIHETSSGNHQYLLIMKGAPEIIIERCNSILNAEDDEIELNDERKNEFEHAYKTYGEHGRRVIGFAHLTFNAPSDITFEGEGDNFPLKNLVFIGICAIMDPPRDETERAIRECREAGIKVFMVTGDHHITATAIARQLKLIGEDRPGEQEKDWEIVRGDQIQKLTERDWDRILSRRNLVFARTTPEQKLQIVEECQRRKQIIAMTGDGVNDSPALKKADIGVGMGSGSDVAKQAADIVLTDDNFCSIVGAVEEGRLMFDNIKKLMQYVLTHAFPEVWAIIINYCFGFPMGITTLIILSIDLGTEIPPGISMSKEPLEGDVMKRPPRKVGQLLVGKAMIFYTYGYTAHIQTLGCFIAYMAVFWGYGITLSDLWMSSLKHWKADGEVFYAGGRNFTVTEQLHINKQAISAWQVGIVLGQCFHVFSCRTLRQSLFTQGVFSNMYIIYSVIIELILLLIFVYCPGVNTFLGGAPCPWYCWAVVAAFGIFIFAYNELRKYCIRHWPNNAVVRWFKF